MKVIVPLAGPDLDHPKYGLKPLYAVDGQPLIARVLESRPWFANGEAADEALVFVLREDPGAPELAAFLQGRFPRARRVTVSHLTAGALMSAVAGAVGGGGGSGGPICVDLADILYDWPAYAGAMLWDGGVGAVAPAFPSRDPAFSYLRRVEGEVVAVAEKQVIGDEATAGTYLFANLGILLAAAAHAVDHADQLAHRGALFVAPALNGVIAAGLRVTAPPVTGVRAIGRMFHAEPGAAA